MRRGDHIIRMGVLIVLVLVIGLVPLMALAGNQGTDHPNCPGREEISVNAQTFTVPDGGPFEVWSKSGNNDHINHGVLSAGTMITSDEFNDRGKEKDISHVDLCPQTTTTTTVAETTTTTMGEPTTTQVDEPTTTTESTTTTIEDTTTTTVAVSPTTVVTEPTFPPPSGPRFSDDPNFYCFDEDGNRIQVPTYEEAFPVCGGVVTSAPPATTPDVLPFTGVSDALIWVAGGLVSLGGLFLFSTRRRDEEVWDHS